jgi:hypothetical protein
MDLSGSSVELSSVVTDIAETVTDLSGAVEHIKNIATDLPGAVEHIKNMATDLPGAVEHIKNMATDLTGAAANLSGAAANMSDVIRALPHLNYTDANSLRVAVLEKFPHLDESAKDFVENHLSTVYEVLGGNVAHAATAVSQVADVVLAKCCCRCW